MSFESYGGTVWSNQPVEPAGSMLHHVAALGAASAVGLGGMYAMTQTRTDGTRMLDIVAGAARYAGNMSPYQIGNTLRVPEWLSPFTSSVYQGLDGGKLTYSNEQLATKGTLEYLEATTGVSRAELQKMGIGPGPALTTAKEMIFERAGDSSRGSLSVISQDGTKHLLSDSMMLMASNLESETYMNRTPGINRAVFGVMQAVGLFSNPNVDETTASHILSKKITNGAGDVVSQLPEYLPVPSVNGPVGSMKNLLDRTAYVRGMSAFSLDRFNRLTQGLAENVLGIDTTQRLKAAIGFGPASSPGTANELFARIGLRAAGVGAVGMGVAQLDWMRRQGGLGGQVIASGIISGGLGYLTSRMASKPATGLMVGVASFFGQTVLPGFDQGIIPGLATAYTKSQVLLATFSPFNAYRRTLEGYLPGVSDWKTGAGIGIAAAAAANFSVPGLGKTLGQHLIDKKWFDPKYHLEGAGGIPLRGPESMRATYYRTLHQRAQVKGYLTNDFVKGFDPEARGSHLKLLDHLKTGQFSGNTTGYFKFLNQSFSAAEDTHKMVERANPINGALLSRLDDISKKYSGPAGTGFLNKTMMHLESFVAQAGYNFLGADTGEAGFAAAAKAKGFKLPLGKTGSVFGLAMLGHQLVTGGLLGTMETAQELRDQYSGKELVEVQNARWWEAGGIPFEGGDTSYYRPHWYALMMNRVREKGVWGENEDSRSPINKFFTKNFTYNLERETYFSRPYPVSSAAFEDVPVIGGILSSTIGRLIKPAKLMHVNEWARTNPDTGEVEFGSPFEGARVEPAYALGATAGVPSNPYSMGNTITDFRHQFRELEGLTGWVKNTATKFITGEELYVADDPTLASASAMTSPGVRFWEANTGGALFMNEALRRIFPKPPSSANTVNPILNNMPSWMPEKYKTGDPYRAIEWGEARLPGSGFAALHPELEGVDPNDYPLIYRYGILADVAPFSKELRMTQSSLYQQRAEGRTSEKMNNYIDMIDKQLGQRFAMQHYEEVHKNAYQLFGSGLTQSVVSTIKSTMRTIAAPFEYMVPMGFRPFQKLMGNRDMIEQYEYERMYGTEMAFWDKPIRDWFRPAMYSAAHMMGYTGKPAWREEADELQARFDQLEFIKWMRLADQATGMGDTRTAQKYMYAAASTRMGINPQGSPLGIYWSLPDSERPFFNAFVQAQGSERDRILNMVPADQTYLYQAIWDKQDAGEPITLGEANKMDIPYMLAQYQAAEQQLGIPPDDWIGWHAEVDLQDIKVKYVDSIGADLHDYGLWEKQLKKAMAQPFLDGSEEYVYDSGNTLRTLQYQQAYADTETTNVSVHGSNSAFGYQSYNWNDNRDSEIASKIGGYFGF